VTPPVGLRAGTQIERCREVFPIAGRLLISYSRGMAFREMDPATIFSLLENHKDTLSVEAAEDERFLSRLVCAQCGEGEMRKKVRIDVPFVAGRALVQWDAECPHCSCVFDPHIFLIKKAGTFVS